ncbi:MAG TPA: VWA domain-containing protein [Candidatus Acidoferrales bacterium]|nr:VWA domain-containing protein [Candidatus Acidoferrales bacterium]
MNSPAARRLRLAVGILFGILLVWVGAGQVAPLKAQSSQNDPAPPSSQGAPPAQAPAADVPEMNTHDMPVPLESRVNLVPVRVIVRDANGHAVANLRKEDFQLFEDGKPQVISNFLLEKLPSAPQPATGSQPESGAAKPEEAHPAAFLPPSRFVALLFDDPGLNQEDLMQARNAANRYLNTSVAPTDRVAVFTVSGLTQLDFTDDRAKLNETLGHLQTRTLTGVPMVTSTDCPPMEYIEADLIQNQHDPQALAVATQDDLACDPPPPNPNATAADIAIETERAKEAAETMAVSKAELGDSQTVAIFRRITEVIRRMAVLPGQRNIVLISPGFIYPNRESDFSKIVDSAIRENIFVSTLDARGLYTPDLGGDISQETAVADPATAGYRSTWRTAGQARQTDTLIYLAMDTGGYAFHGNNDLGEGLRQVAGAPEAYYYIAFVPHNLNFDGRFHSLKVTLVPKEKFSVQARRGYYAPKHGETPAEAARRDIDDALFSQEEQHGLPVELQTQYYKTNATDAKLAILAHVDLAHVRFDKANGRNQNDLTVVTAIFDRNGNFITGNQKIVEMNLRDETLQRLSHTGVTVRTSFDVKPGDYVVRLVVRDSKASALSAENGSVEIPY